MAFDFVLVIFVVSLLVVRHSRQPQSLQRVGVKTPGQAQAVVTLITHDRATRPRAVNSVDFSLVITLAAQLCLSGGNGRACIFIRRIVGSLAVIIAFINAPIILVRIIIVRVVIVRITVWVPRESEIEDEPRAVDKAATVAMPEVVAIAVPIVMPIG